MPKVLEKKERRKNMEERMVLRKKTDSKDKGLTWPDFIFPPVNLWTMPKRFID